MLCRWAKSHSFTHGYHSASFHHCCSLPCAFDPLPQAVIGQDIGARQAQILPLAAEIWHIILSLSHPLGIKFFCPVIFKKFAPLVGLGLRKSKAQTLYRQSRATGTCSAEPKWRALVGCEGDSGHELNQGSNYRCQETEAWTVKALSHALQRFPVPSLSLFSFNSMLSLFPSFPLTYLPFCLSLFSWLRKPVLTQCRYPPLFALSYVLAYFLSDSRLSSHISHLSSVVRLANSQDSVLSLEFFIKIQRKCLTRHYRALSAAAPLLDLKWLKSSM